MSQWLLAGGWQAVGGAMLVALLIGAAWVDIRSHRIPNKLVFPGVIVALLLAHLPGGSLSSSLIGIAIGMGVTLPMYWLRAMGAGDVKLMGMVGGFLGGVDIIGATLVIFVVGGALGLLAAFRKRAVRELGGNLKEMAYGGLFSTMAGGRPAVPAPIRSVGVQPYGVAIAAGTVLYLAIVKWSALA